MRTFAILNDKNHYDFNESIISKLNPNEKIYIFTAHDYVDDNKSKYPNSIIVELPEDSISNEPKMRNFISKFFKDSNIGGFLHVLSRTTYINADPYNFFDKIEDMMKKIKNDVWFNCSCDPVNYIYSKFNPRYTLEIDDDDAKKSYEKTLMLCSNANTQWIIYDLDSITYERMAFDDNFTIAMFYIIKFLAERRNNKKAGEFYYMNMYPTIKEELGVFSSIRSPKDKDDKTDKELNEIMKTEDELFKNMHLNYSPDHDIVQISEDLRNILVS